MMNKNLKINKRREQVLSLLKVKEMSLEELVLGLEKETNNGLVRFSRLDELCWFKKDFLRYMRVRMMNEGLCLMTEEKKYKITEEGLLSLKAAETNKLYRMRVS